MPRANFFAIVLAVAAILGSLFLGTRAISLHCFEGLERQDTVRNVERARNILDVEIQQISTTAGDYAGWDDAYAFVQNRDPAFVTSNLDDAIYGKLRLNIFILCDASGTVIYGRAFDYRKNHPIPMPASLSRHLAPGGKLVSHPKAENIVAGLLRLPEGLMLVVSRPILTSKYEGPVKGALIAGRFLDNAEIMRLSEKTLLDLKVVDFAAIHDDVLQGVLRQLPDTRTVHVQATNADTIAGYGLLRDIYGADTALVQVSTSRQIVRQGRDSIRHFFMLFGATGAVFAIALTLLNKNLAVSRRQRDQTEEQLRSFIELAVDGIFTGDGQGNFIGVNSRACELTGYSRDELLKKNMKELFSEAELQRMPLQYSLLSDGRTITAERWLTRRDGSVVAVEMRSKRLPDGTHQAFMQDVTERRRSEEKLRQSEERFRQVVELSPVMVMIHSQGRFVYLNRAALRLFGADNAEELIGSPIIELVHPDFRELVRGRVTNAISDAKAAPVIEEKLLRLDGTVFTVEITSIPFLFQGEGGVLTIANDISARKQAEDEIRQLNIQLEQRVAERTAELESALRHMESFSYSISHDLRAPLRAVDGYCQMLTEDFGQRLPSGANDYLGKISRNVRQMAALIDDLLTFSRLNRQPLTKQQVNLAGIAREVLILLDDERAGRSIEIVIGDLPPCQADPVLIRQVLLNLLSNAFKFTRALDAARIEFGSSTEGGMTTYFVRDNGAGFDMAFAARLFGVFQRLHGSEQFEGTGVGLAIVRNIVQRHGGRVWAEGEVGLGATFYFTLEGGEAIGGADGM